MYKEALEKYAATSTEFRAFAAGFVSGQAEKIYLGACRAAMFRPSQDRTATIIEIANDVAARYGLVVVHPIGAKQEVWICRPANEEDVRRMTVFIEDSPAWHERRAWLCGIPEKDVDLEFHKRAGHGERCD